MRVLRMHEWDRQTDTAWGNWDKTYQSVWKTGPWAEIVGNVSETLSWSNKCSRWPDRRPICLQHKALWTWSPKWSPTRTQWSLLLKWGASSWGHLSLSPTWVSLKFSQGNRDYCGGAYVGTMGEHGDLKLKGKVAECWGKWISCREKSEQERTVLESRTDWLLEKFSH
jgi:hypothetical protein